MVESALCYGLRLKTALCGAAALPLAEDLGGAYLLEYGHWVASSLGLLEESLCEPLLSGLWIEKYFAISCSGDPLVKAAGSGCEKFLFLGKV